MSLNTSTMRVSDVMRYVKRQFGDESGVQLVDADIYAWLNMGIKEVAINAKVSQSRATTSVVAQQASYALPPNIALEIVLVRYDNKQLEGLSFQQANELLQDSLSQTGVPKYWYRWGNEVFLWPVPDQSVPDILSVFYIGVPELVTEDDDLLPVPDRYFEPICLFVLSKALEMDEDYSASNQTRQLYETRLADQFEEDNRGPTAMYPSITFSDID